MAKHLSEITDPVEFENAFYGKHGMTPADALRGTLAPIPVEEPEQIEPGEAFRALCRASLER